MSRLQVAGQWLAALYNPQRRVGRSAYARSLFAAALLYAALWSGSMALADCESLVSDAAILWLARYPVPLLTNLLLFFTMAATARRLHDMGCNGAAALLLCLPETWLVLIPLALVVPSTERAVCFARASDADGGTNVSFCRK